MKDLQADKGDQISKEASINDFIIRGSSDFFGEIIIRFVMFFSLCVSMVSLGKNPRRDGGHMMYTGRADLSIYYLNMIRI